MQPYVCGCECETTMFAVDYISYLIVGLDNRLATTKL